MPKHSPFFSRGGLKSICRPVTTCIAASLLGGCVVGPNYRAPNPETPSAFDKELSTAGTAAATQPSGNARRLPVDVTVWWRSLDEPELNSIVERTVANNYDLRIAVARLQEAREVNFAVGGGAVPLLGAPHGLSLVAAAGRSSGNDAARGRLGGPVYSGVDTTGLQEITHVAGFDAGWEFDLFGRYTRLIESAQADEQAAYEMRNDVLISVVADVVRSYIDVRSLQMRLEIARENAASQKRTANLVRIRFTRGLTNQLDVVLAQRQLSTTLAFIAPLEASLASAERRIAVLTGGYPESLRKELDIAHSLPAIPPAVRPGMPIELLRRRPDIRQAERLLAADTARVGVATSNLFPRVSLTGGLGLEGQGLGRTPNLTSMIWSIGPTLYWPFLDFGQLDATVKISNYRAQAALLYYEKTVVSAVEEVDNALSNYDAEQQRLAQLGYAVESSKKAVHIATQRYEDGLTDFLNVLDAQRQLYELQDQYAVAKQSVIYQFIFLYKSLGGGWEGFEATPPAARPAPAIMAAIGQVVAPPRAVGQSVR